MDLEARLRLNPLEQIEAEGVNIAHSDDKSKFGLDERSERYGIRNV